MTEHTFEPGVQCICQSENWYNAFGEKTVMIPVGTKLVLTKRMRLHGAMFLEFDEYPKLQFLSTGFKSLRSLN